MSKIRKEYKQLLKLIAELDTRELLCYHVQAITGEEDSIDEIPDSLLEEFSKIHKQLNGFCTDWIAMNRIVEIANEELLSIR